MPVATSLCLSPTCRSTVAGNVTTCPTCGTRMRTPRMIRMAGWFMLVIGIILTIITVTFTSESAPGVFNPAGASSARVVEFDQRCFIMFGVAAVFGVVSILYALRLIVTGRNNMAMVKGLIGFGVVGIAIIVYQLLHLPS
jgi:hypothetical protein